MQNSTSMLNNIFLEEIIKSKLLDTNSITPTRTKLKEQGGHAMENIPHPLDMYGGQKAKRNAELGQLSSILNKYGIDTTQKTDPRILAFAKQFNISLYDTPEAVTVRNQIAAATNLQEKIASSLSNGFLKDPYKQDEFMAYMKPEAQYNKMSAADKKIYFIPWRNKAADSFFSNIVKRGARNYSGIFKNVTNPDNQAYSYQILMVDSKGKSRCTIQFHPDGYCNISDIGPLAVDRWKYEVISGTVYIATPGITQWVIQCTPESFYLIAQFNPALADTVYDPYEGAGFWKSIWLDLNSYRDDNKWATTKAKTQAAYEASSEYWIDVVQTAGDWLGLIPGYGDIIDILNGIGYAARGKKFEAALSFIAIIPLVGSIVKLGFKSAFKTLKMGTKTGIDVIEELITNPETVWTIITDYVKKNKASKQMVKDFIKSLAKAATWRTAMSSIIAGIRKLWAIPGSTWIADGLQFMMTQFGKLVDDALRNAGSSLTKLISATETGSDLAKIGGKDAATELATQAVKSGKSVAGDITGEALQAELIMGIGSALIKNANDAGPWLYKMLGKPFWDAVAQGMASNFVRFAQALPPRKFVALLKASPDGIRLLIKGLENYKGTILKFINENGLMQGVINSADEAGQWRQFTSYILKASESQIQTIGETIIYPAFHASNNKLSMQAYTDFIYITVTSLIKNGNAVYKLWCMKYWNVLKAMLPMSVFRWSTKKGLSFMNYGSTRNPIIGATSFVRKSMDDYITSSNWIVRAGKALVKLLTKILDGAMNLKRLDIYWNEIQDFFDKTTAQKVNTPDTKQGVIVSTISYFLGNTLFEALEWLFGMASEVIPQGVQTINKPSQVPMIKNKRFVTDLDAKDDK